MKSFKKIVKNNLYMLKFMFRAKPVYCILNMFFATAQDLTFGVFGSIFFMKYLVDSVTTGLNEPALIPELFRTCSHRKNMI